MALQGFDKDYYLNAKLDALQNDPDADAAWQGRTTADLENILQNDYGLTPEQHYARYGYQEDLAPNAYFNAEEYVQAKARDMVDNGDVATVTEARGEFEARWQGNPYEHYLQYGASEGINPSNDFDASAYYAEKLDALQNDPETAEEWSGKSVDDVQQAFADAGLTPLGHFVAYGDEENLTAPEVPAGEDVPGEDDEQPPTDGGGEEPPTDGGGEEPPTDGGGEEPPTDGGDDTITDDEILEVDGQNLASSYDFNAAELDGYRAIRFSNVDTTDTVNIDNLGADNRLYTVDSALALNIAAASAAQLDLTNSDVTLFGQQDTPVLDTLDVVAQAGDGSGSTLDLGGSAADALTGMTLSGAGDLTLAGSTIGAQATEASTIDATAMTGSLTAGDGILDAVASVQAGSGDDALTLDSVAAPVDGTAPMLDGGAGNDTLTVTGSDDIGSSDVSGFETLELGSYVDVDANAVDGVTNFVVGAAGSEVQNLAADQTVTSRVDQAPDEAPELNLRDAAESVSVVTDFAGPAQGETLQLGVYTTDTGVEGGTLSLSGNGGVAYTEAGRKFDSVDASSLDAGLDFTGADYVQETVTLGEGDAADTIAVSATNSTGDTIPTSSYGDEDMDAIVNFDVASDQIVNGDGTSAVDFTADYLDVSGAGDLTGAFEAAAAESTGGDDYVAFQFQDNAYVYADSEAAVDGSGPELSDGDFAIELTGITLPASEEMQPV
ncbi:hypothetical protein [Modicisalibacter coralii]|uniref:hypothetical protein n=1 Tax=Modicisalibacter coralii TaxID=2304602 RepID=UPI00100BC5BC|nr:hypothetical protein [Halomonas coralii]